MNAIMGEKAQKFVIWLNKAREFLPPRMSLDEARDIFLRKLDEEEIIKNEKKQKAD